MQHTITPLENGEYQVTITLQKHELRPHYDRAYERAQPNIEIKGFRKGKVPLNIVKQHYGPSIEAETLEQIAQDEFASIMEAEKIEVLDQPVIRDIQKQPESVTFDIRFQSYPEFDIADYKGMALARPFKQIDEDDIDREVHNICVRFGTTESADKIDSDLFIATVTLAQIDPTSGIPLLEKKQEEMKIFLRDEQIDPTLREQLLHRSLNESFQYSPPSARQGSGSVQYLVTIHAIHRIVPAEFGNELVERITDGEMKTTEELRDDLERQLQKVVDDEGRKALEEQVYGQILFDNRELKPPSALFSRMLQNFVHDTLQRAGQQKPTQQQVEQVAKMNAPYAHAAARWFVLRKKISKLEGITVEDFEVEPMAEYALRQIAQQGGQDVDLEAASEASREQAYEQIEMNKVFDAVIASGTVQEMSFEEYHTYQHTVEDKRKEILNTEGDAVNSSFLSEQEVTGHRHESDSDSSHGSGSNLIIVP